ncbi:DUF1080 domain-containing protein [Maribacter algicola]|uniref:DUF1080 domain-containing protein n=1 Tax=Meishania litoralis TaxID=3434685 RepID=A0ACC7LFH5_9FLAO
MRYIFSLIFSFALTFTVCGQNSDAKKTVLFNGEDLEHWQIPEDNVWWTIEEGSLWAKSDPEQKGSNLWTKKEYSDFVVQLDFKFGKGTVDSGIFMRGESEKNAQIQIGISGSLKRDMTASPYIPKMGYPVEAEQIKELLRMDDWNTIKAEAVGNAYKVWLNGQKVMEYVLEGADLKGPIGLQLHPGRDMTIQFRNISVTELD